MRVFEQLRRDTDDVRYLTRRERMTAAAAGLPLVSAGLALSWWRLLDPTLPVWWVLGAALVWVLLAAWPVAAVTVRLRARAQQRRRAEAQHRIRRRRRTGT